MAAKPKRCDVCGLSIYLLSLQDAISKGVPMKMFTMAGLKKPVCECELCQMKMESAIIAHDWKLLPDGPLKQAFTNEDERRGRSDDT